jgi:hypothetical protein
VSRQYHPPAACVSQYYGRPPSPRGRAPAPTSKTVAAEPCAGHGAPSLVHVDATSRFRRQLRRARKGRSATAPASTELTPARWAPPNRPLRASITPERDARSSQAGDAIRAVRPLRGASLHRLRPPMLHEPGMKPIALRLGKVALPTGRVRSRRSCAQFGDPGLDPSAIANSVGGDEWARPHGAAAARLQVPA